MDSPSRLVPETGVDKVRGLMVSRRRFLLQLALVLTLPAMASEVGLTAPQQVVQRLSDELRQVLRKDRTLLETDRAYVHRLVDELLMPNVDYQRVCSLVLGPVWKEANPAQREAFGAAFKTLLINTYATAVNELSEWEIRYLPLRLQPGEKEVVVRTQILYPGGEPIDVDYRMYEKGGRWLAYDVAVAGVSLLASYRSTFIRMARQKGIDGLIADLAERNALRDRSPSSHSAKP